MKVLLINYEYPPIGGGASNATFNIAKKMVDLGNDVFVITANYSDLKGITQENGIHIHRIKCKRNRRDRSNIFEMISFVFNAFLYLPSFLKRNKIENSIIFFSIPCGPIGLLLKWFSIDYIISLRGSDVPEGDSQLNFIHKVISPLRRLVLRKSLAIVANSKGLKELSEKHDPYAVDVIPNGVDTDYYKSIIKQKTNTLNLIFVGRLHNEKNIPFLFRVLKKLVVDNNRSVNLHIVGDGPLSKELHNMARDLKINDYIVWHGWCDKLFLKELYNSSHVLANPSFNEGMPNVVLEALASGLPCVVSDVMGNNEVVIDGYNGFLFDLDNSEQCVEQIESIIDDKNLYMQLSKNARNFVENKYSWENTAKEYIDLLYSKEKKNEK